MLCKTCGFEYVCTQCVSTVHKGHMISPMKLNRIVGPESMCKTHGRPFIYVCRTCREEPLCWNCFFPRHKGHDTFDHEEYMKQTREKILHQPEEKIMKGKLDNARNRIRDKRDELKTEVDIVANKLLQEYKTLMKNSKSGISGPEFHFCKLHKTNVVKVFGSIELPKKRKR